MSYIKIRRKFMDYLWTLFQNRYKIPLISIIHYQLFLNDGVPGDGINTGFFDILLNSINHCQMLNNQLQNRSRGFESLFPC